MDGVRYEHKLKLAKIWYPYMAKILVRQLDGVSCAFKYAFLLKYPVLNKLFSKMPWKKSFIYSVTSKINKMFCKQNKHMHQFVYQLLDFAIKQWKKFNHSKSLFNSFTWEKMHKNSWNVSVICYDKYLKLKISFWDRHTLIGVFAHMHHKAICLSDQGSLMMCWMKKKNTTKSHKHYNNAHQRA